VIISIDKATALRLADQASDSYIKGASASLNRAIIDLVKDTEYNEEQLDRIAQAANQSAWSKLCSQKDPSEVKFELASAKVVLAGQEDTKEQEMRDPRWGDSAISPSLEPEPKDMTKLVTASLTKQAAESVVTKGKDIKSKLKAKWYNRNNPATVATPKVSPVKAAAFIPRNDETRWDQLADKVAQAADELVQKVAKLELVFTSGLSTLLKTAEQMRIEQVSKETILGTVRHVVGGEVGEGVSAWLDKNAHFQNFQEYFDIFEKMASKTDGHVTIWDQPAPLTETVPSDDFSVLNPDHQLVKISKMLRDTYDESEVLHIALERMQEQENQARRLALQGLEVQYGNC